MKSSCIEHPAHDRFIIIRAWQLAYCAELKTAAKVGAAILSVFEYTHNKKLSDIEQEQLLRPRFEPTIDDLLQEHTYKSMEQHIRGIGKRNTIIKAMDYLLDKQVIAKIGGARNNQNFWLFKPEKINEWLIMTYPSRPFSNGLTDTSRLKKDDLENPSRPFSNGKPFKKGRLVVQKRTTNKKNKEKGILLSEEYEKEKRGGVFFQKEEKNFSTRRVQNSSPPSSAAPPHDPHIVTVEMDRQAAQVLDHLNEITDSNYRNTGRNKKDIVARLKEGYLVDDFKKVIELKAMQWANTKQAQYLRPSTLFGDHFESYLIFAEKAALNPKIVKNTSNVHEPIISKESIISVAESVLAENLYGN